MLKMKEKKCKGCNKILPISRFSKWGVKSDGTIGYINYCHKCHYQRNKEKKLKNNKKHYNKEQRKEYYENNREKLLEYQKNLYPKRDKEYINARMRLWRKNNPKHKKYINQYMKKYLKEKYHNDTNFKLIDTLRNRFYRSLKRGKGNLAFKFLGISLDKFKELIQKQFKPEMNWSNWGTVWELDHILPISSFDLKDENQVKECFHYTNFQPLFKTTDIAEGFGYKNEIGNRNKSNN
jgi:hypothetical protein